MKDLTYSTDRSFSKHLLIFNKKIWRETRKAKERKQKKETNEC